MNYLSLKLDKKAQAIVSDLLEGLEAADSWHKMTARLAAQIDSKLTESDYVGKVEWFSDLDYIEKEIDYR